MPSSFMGCGISKLNLEETRPGYQIRTLRRRSDVKDREDETDSLTSKQRKSTSSMTSEDGSRDGGFLKRVIDNGEEEGEENKSKNTGTDKKGSETLPAKRGRKGRGFRSAMHMGGSTRGLRSVLQRGGSAGMKNILNGTSCRSQTSSPPHDSTTKLIAKAV
ncbi:hypothetical protein GH714_032177 [Hevea brasiliensis]|uniref:Uncharacterized protein n=1 Tax=Hevea brasiliensis TaxID=3981 RepID=A0A6A6ND33_HEVBR|nr:hypothetical protein GH714_032177 [Hevea brasiliensis]